MKSEQIKALEKRIEALETSTWEKKYNYLESAVRFQTTTTTIQEKNKTNVDEPDRIHSYA